MEKIWADYRLFRPFDRLSRASGSAWMMIPWLRNLLRSAAVNFF